MKINNIELTNFKLHHNLKFSIEKKNCLIYGENGSGKSSIYKALYSNFYYLKDKDIVNNIIDIRETFRHRDYPAGDFEVNIVFDQQSSQLNRKDNTVINSELIENETIYFTDAKIFHKIIENDFYSVVQNELVKHFPELGELLTLYKELERKLNKIKPEDQVFYELYDDRKQLDNEFKRKFYQLIPIDKINNIIENNFDEHFEIEFLINDSSIEDRKLVKPKISVKIAGINDNNDLINHFNESKLKLISVAIYFSLAKEFENSDSNLKLLVLDDFLTSLDMANRNLLIKYILDNFKKYQIIIFTHNIQFYNLIIKLLNFRNENNKWDIKKIFSRMNDTIEESIIYSKNSNYLKSAKENLFYDKLQISGNLLRKEFEKIINEFKQILELGKTEKLSSIINSLKSEKNSFFKHPHESLDNISNLLNKFDKIVQNIEQPIDKKFLQVQKEIISIKKVIRKNKCDISEVQNLLSKTSFYKSIFMNPASHDDSNTEIYRKECVSSILLLEKLNKILSELKKER